MQVDWLEFNGAFNGSPANIDVDWILSVSEMNPFPLPLT